MPASATRSTAAASRAVRLAGGISGSAPATAPGPGITRTRPPPSPLTTPGTGPGRGPTVIYLATAFTPAIRAAIAAGRLGQLVTPNSGNKPIPGARWALDAGADVQELANSRVAGQVPHRPNQEAALSAHHGPRPIRATWQRLGAALGCLPVRVHRDRGRAALASLPGSRHAGPVGSSPDRHRSPECAVRRRALRTRARHHAAARVRAFRRPGDEAAFYIRLMERLQTQTVQGEDARRLIVRAADER
jgi:hypothetical protein